MTRFPVSSILLLIVSLLIYLGIGHRLLDRMRITDKQALAVLAGIIIGSFIDIPIPGTRFITSINVGGALIPVGLAIYLLSKAGTGKEVFRAIISTIITAFAVYFVGSLINRGLPEPSGNYAILDALFLYPLVGGIVAYLAGRSRRSAFIAATLGVLAVDMYHYYWLFRAGAPGYTRVSIGGGGAFDAIMLAGLLAILLAEVIGETRERLQGGPESEGKPEELLVGLRKPIIDDAHDHNKNDSDKNEFDKNEFDNQQIFTGEKKPEDPEKY